MYLDEAISIPGILKKRINGWLQIQLDVASAHDRAGGKRLSETIIGRSQIISVSCVRKMW